MRGVIRGCGGGEGFERNGCIRAVVRSGLRIDSSEVPAMRLAHTVEGEVKNHVSPKVHGCAPRYVMANGSIGPASGGL